MNYSKQNRRQIRMRHKARLIDKKRRIKNKKRKYMIYYIIFAIIFIGTTLILSLTVFFKIEKINIACHPEKKSMVNEVESCLKIEVGDNLIMVDSKKSINRLIKKFTNLSSVEITKKFPNQINITCDFEPVKFIINNNDDKFLGVSKSGRIIKNFIKKPVNLNNILAISIKTKQFKLPKLGDFLVIPQQEQQILKSIQNTLKNSGLNNITKIEIYSNYEIKITYNNKIIIEIDNISKIEKIINMATTIINQYIGANETGTIKFLERDKTMHFIPDFNYVQNKNHDEDDETNTETFEENFTESTKTSENYD